MADGTPFLLPVVIDATKDGEALVPEEFRAVQWTRLRPAGFAGPARGEADEAMEKFCARVKALLGGDAVDVGPVADRAPGQRPGLQPETSRRVPAAAWIAAAVVVVGGASLYFALRPASDAGAGPRPTAAEKNASTAAWPRDPELRRAMALVNGTEANPEDFALAEEITKKVLDKNSTDPEAVTVMARVQVAYLFRGFDFSDERFAGARRYAERAVQLGRDDPEALVALGIVFYLRGADLPRARELFERAVALKPSEPFLHRFRDRALVADVKVPPAEALAASERTAALFPGDALAHYELARHYRDAGRLADMERELDRTLAITPLTNALVWKARLALLVRADPAEMKALLDRVPARTRSGERVVISRWIYAMVTSQAEDGLSALAGLTSKWIDDFEYVGPTALLTAQLLELQGKPELARVQHAAALAELQARKARDPGNLNVRAAEPWLLRGLGREVEARLVYRGTLEGLSRPYRYSSMGDWWFSAIPACLLMGDRANALELIREAVTPAAVADGSRQVIGDGGTLSSRWIGPVGGETYAAEARAALRLRFKLDPRMAPFRDDKEIVALLAEPAVGAEKKTVAAPVSEGAQLAARALALFTKTSFTRDDLVVAEDFARSATEKEPGNAVAWGVRAGVQSAWIFRNWDQGEKRRQETQALANKALALDAGEPEAQLALAHVLRAQGSASGAEALLRRALEVHPAHTRLARTLGFTLFLAGKNDEAMAILTKAAQLAPRDPIVRYDLAMAHTDYGARGADPANLAGALEQLDAAIALQPFGSALLLKATLLGGWRGDLPAMRATLDQLDALPLAVRSEDRAVALSMWAGLIERRPDRVDAAATLTARSYFEDAILALRPKAWSLALAHRVAGKEALARRDWQAAEAVLRQRLRDDAANEISQVELAITLAWLEQREEAARLIAAVEPVWREESLRSRGRAPLLARYYGAAGDPVRAAEWLARALDQTVFMSRKVVPLDPWWDKVRAAPEFQAALKAPAN